MPSPNETPAVAAAKETAQSAPPPPRPAAVTPPAQATTAELREALLAKMEKADLTGENIGQEKGSSADPRADQGIPPMIEPPAQDDPQKKTSDEPPEKPGKPDADETPGDGDEAGTGKEPADSTAAEIAAERKRLKEERAALERERETFDAQAAAATGELKQALISADQLEKYAAEWREDGQDSLADAATERAAFIRENAKAAGQKAATADFTRKRDACIREVIEEYPELAKEGSPMFQGLNALLKAKPVFTTYPEGIRDAAQALAAHMSGSKAKELEAELEKLKTENKALARRLQPANGRPSAHRGDPSFSRLTATEQRARLLESLQTAESRGEPAFSRR